MVWDIETFLPLKNLKGIHLKEEGSKSKKYGVQRKTQVKGKLQISVVQRLVSKRLFLTGPLLEIAVKTSENWKFQLVSDLRVA